ncbi:hemerythrin domain-containing protein [Actinoplanes teichomyceticus]|uniref:Hemerythrin HHE cation binding domain-containing protein n=1 Tax=Actinoplanes teichomyceticus TaxID=1867 RepID=A0A561W9N5_ACTTI|nr:hemerythrin domain-containing protein [Actinoplanes teichomyceticus]TWG20585.1 hemerythrin HHE cation binding domain-containing protein [Actinoplanes teichomyceticus]GIF15920.1 hemerythrin [Actinoplanes teichomyceticus]
MSDVNLPPLPPVGGTTSGRSVVDVLDGQHRQLLRLADRAGAEPDAAKVRSVLVATLSRHLSAEEQYLYPAVRAAVPDGDRIADRELAEDRELLCVMRAAEADPARVPEMVAAVRRHVDADARELFPLLEQMVPAEDMIRLGNRVEMAQEAAPTRPHPRTPATPPWNKVVDPLLGVIDKVRDVVSARATYVRDL